ncbi:pheromone processing endoprotease [Ceratobasidium sp. 428]|nr:pheromone processing endoprotease [Ceratobasidium sp. 428]
MPSLPRASFSTFDQIRNAMDIHDPSPDKQWQLFSNISPRNDLSVLSVCNMGITGEGVTACVVDDGLDTESEDLASKFFSGESYDYNDHKPPPKPKLLDDQHGVRCAREVSAARDDIYSVGASYAAKITGVHILSGPKLDADEEQLDLLLLLRPPDNFQSMEAPGLITENTVVRGVQEGLVEKGYKNVFTSGNGAGSDDQRNFGGYANSIFSVIVAVVDTRSLHPYSESCAANMVIAYNSCEGQNITMEVLPPPTFSLLASLRSASKLDQSSPGVTSNICTYAQPYRSTQRIQTGNTLPSDDPTATNTAMTVSTPESAEASNLVKLQVFMKLKPTVLSGADISRAFWGEMKGETLIPEGGVKSKVEVTVDMLRERNCEKLEHITVKAHEEGGRDEDPVGKWKICVSDQHDAAHNGSFLAWSMSMFNSVIDPYKVEPWTAPDDPIVPLCNSHNHYIRNYDRDGYEATS